ncbi:hypothetical protein TNIN_232561 [Trichonephila inaurata madagascariensis]|uniref:Uncharacterized protein n=1 Tax=Trichonephila inaurata madagascariensis TaxID=2747483 RepID=A0A8X7CHQ1_9ARAC|nr:hypothetical protein TNIN_232561 [Trichonephila inaurata madagascariensis]
MKTVASMLNHFSKLCFLPQFRHAAITILARKATRNMSSAVSYEHKIVNGTSEKSQKIETFKGPLPGTLDENMECWLSPHVD